MDAEREKPLKIKNYGSIGHLPNSRMGSGDHHIHDGQARLATEKLTPKNGAKREVIVQEKLDGSNVGIARMGDEIIPLSRAGYRATTSPFTQHHAFHEWAVAQKDRWLALLGDGERLVGEWLMQAHSTRYKLQHEPFVAFDIMTGDTRVPYDTFKERVSAVDLTTPYLIHRGDALSVEEAMQRLGKFGFHGAEDEVEGAVWRVEVIMKNARKVEYLCKYVRPDKKDGIYLKDDAGNDLPPIFNWRSPSPDGR